VSGEFTIPAELQHGLVIGDQPAEILSSPLRRTNVAIGGGHATPMTSTMGLTTPAPMMSMASGGPTFADYLNRFTAMFKKAIDRLKQEVHK
jgi:hypothetical protein